MTEKVIVKNSSAEIRAIARTMLKGNWLNVFLAVLIMNVCVLVPSFVSGMYITSEIGDFVSTILVYVIGFAFTLGIYTYFISLVRNRDRNVLDVFSGFEHILKVTLLGLRILFFTLLWTLLFIIPGIIAAYRYSLSFYILADHPEYTGKQCVEESKRLTEGNKGRIFVLNLSFLGWYFLWYICTLAILTFAGLGTAVTLAAESVQLDLQTGTTPDFNAALLNEINGTIAIAFIICMLPAFLIQAYNGIAQTILYDMITGKIKIGRNEDDGSTVVEVNGTVEKTEDVVEADTTEVGFKEPDSIVKSEDTSDKSNFVTEELKEEATKKDEF